MQTELMTHTILLVLFTLLALGVLLVTRRLKWVSVPAIPSNSEVSGFLVAVAFIFYFALFKVLGPLILLVSLKASSISLDISTTVMVNLSFIWVATALIVLMTFAFGRMSRLAVWSPRNCNFKKVFKALILSPFFYLIAFPWILVAGEVYNILGIFIYGEPPQVIEQSMVTFLRQILPFPWLFGFTAFTVIVIVPIQEEILFRGLLQRWLTRRTSISVSIALSSLLFSLLHFGPDQGFSNVVLIPTLFCFSIFLGIVYEKFGTLLAPIALHSFFNGISIFFMVNGWFSAG